MIARARSPIVLLVLLASGWLLLRSDLPHTGPSTAKQSLDSVGAIYGRLPLAFEPNRGQTDSSVKFLAHGSGYGIFLTSSEAVLSLPGHSSVEPGASLGMRLVGSQSGAELTGMNRLPGRSNYLLGNDPSQWRTNIPHFSRVRYRGVYPGIDLDFYGKQGRLEYDFDVAPGADFRSIELDLSGAQKLKLVNGDLVIEVNGRELRFQSPHVYQEGRSGEQVVAGNFVLRGDNKVGFAIGDYDRTRTLVIDPVLTFSTFLGGSGNESCAQITGAPALTPFVANCPAIAIDAGQEVYISGATTNTASFPAPAGGASSIPPLGGSSDVFITKINSSGTAVEFTTFIGGSGRDYPTGIGLDSGLNVYIAGTSTSADYPTTPTAFQAAAPGTHVFFSKLDPTGSVNLYSTFLAGTGTDSASSLAVDSQGRAYIFGTTTSSDFPVTATALQATALATNQFFFSKLDPNSSGQNSLLFSTFIGGSTPANGSVMGGAIAVDPSFNVYLAGGTNFTDMPVLNAANGSALGGLDVWAAKLNAPANNTQQYTPSFETYFGGSGDDIAYGVASDGTNTFVTGSTTSTNITIPTGVAPFQGANAGGTDAFIAKFGVPAVTGTTQGAVPVSYFTYLGGNGTDTGLAIVSDPGTSVGNVRVTGLTTDSSNWAAPVQNKLGPGGANDAFMARIITTTTTTTTANTSSVTFVGGSGDEVGTSLVEDSSLNTYITGETFSGNFPVAAPPGSTALQSSPGGSGDAFVSKLGPNVAGLLSFTCNPGVPVSGAGCPQPPNPVPANPAVNPTPVGVGNTITFTYSIFNQGDPVTGAVFTDTVQGTNSQITQATSNSGGTCTIASGGTSALCNLGTINTSSTTSTTTGSTTTSTTASAATVTITVTSTVPPSTGVVPPKPPDVGNIGQISVPGTSFTAQTTSGSASVNDFGVTAKPTSNTVKAGVDAPYQITVTPTGPIPESVSLSCTGLPAGSSCAFQNSNASIPNLNNGPASRALNITTTVRVTTPAKLFGQGGPIYAIWLPLSGLALFGSSISRKRKLLLSILALAAAATFVAFQIGCGYSNNRTSSTTGTPAGTYNVTVNATSGSATRSTVLQLIVQ